MTRDAKFYTTFWAACLSPAVAYVIRAWYSYAGTKEYSLEIDRVACSGDIACIADLTQERWVDFVIGATLGAAPIFVATFAAVFAFVLALDWLRFRYRRSAQAKTEK